MGEPSIESGISNNGAGDARCFMVDAVSVRRRQDEKDVTVVGVAWVKEFDGGGSEP